LAADTVSICCAPMVALAVISIIIDLLERQYTHQIEILNFTELELDFEQPYTDEGAATYSPTIMKLGAMRLVDLPDGTQQLVAQTTQYAFQNLWRVLPNAALPNGLVATVDVSHWEDNSISLDFEQVSRDWEAIYNAVDGKNQVLTMTTTYGDYVATLTMNGLNGRPNCDYTSTLTIWNSALYPQLDLVSVR
jgi:hypothetical protein